MKFYQLFKHLAFAIDPERAHNLSLSMLSRFPLIFSEVFRKTGLDPRMKLKVGSLDWPFPVGLAAGLDKNAKAIDFFSSILFGAVEVGTVTPLAQAGNPKPRMFRLLKEESLRNQMGFNNDGAQSILANIKNSHKGNRVLGVNLGKNKVTPADEAPLDYQKLYASLWEVSDYMVINLSSPNTPGLRDLLQVDSLRKIFLALKELREKHPRPLYLKISPDMAIEDIDSIIDIVGEFHLEGIIGTNTTIIPEIGSGGVSGKILSQKAALIRREFLKKIKEKNLDLSFIGVGGISSFEDVWDFWKAGGRALQIYTAFIYQGPQLLEEIQRRTIEVIEKNGLKDLEELLDKIETISL